MGYFKIDRCIADHWLWKEKPFDRARAWIDLIMEAQFSEGGKARIDGEISTIQRGQLYTTLQKLSDRWGWTRSKVLRFLTRLEAEQMVTLNRNKDGTRITIENYAKYQDVGNTNRNTSETPPKHERNTTETPTYLYKNVRKEEGKNIGGKTKFSPPTSEEVRAYCDEKVLLVDAEAFIDFYASKGWMVGKNKMTDWKAACRNWARSQKRREQVDEAKQLRGNHTSFMDIDF